jgi:hypothetical protein
MLRGNCVQILGVVILGSAVAMTSPIRAADADEVCKQHMKDPNPATHDPKIEERVKTLAIRLLTGDPTFVREWNVYSIELRKGNAHAAPTAPDIPNGGDRFADASIDLHCYVPLEVRLQGLPEEKIRLDVDLWRSYVNAAVYNLSTHHLDVQHS